MIRFTLSHLLKNAPLMAWPILIIVFILTSAVLGEVVVSPYSPFQIIYENGFRLSAIALGTQILSIIGLILMVALPIHLAENLKPERASLLLSKPVSRTEFFLGDIAAVFLITLYYSLICIISFAAYFGLTTGTLPVGFLLSFLCYPILAIMYYATMHLVLMLTRAYLFAILAVFLISPLSIFLFISDEVLTGAFNVKSEILLQTAEILNYIIPSSGAVTVLYQNLLRARNEWNEIGEAFTSEIGILILVSGLPFFGLSYFLFLKKEF